MLWARYDFYLKNIDGKWVVERDKTEQQVYDLRKDPVEPDEEILMAGKRYHEATLEYTGTIIGTATADFKEGYSDEIKGISQGKLQDTPLINLVNQFNLEIRGQVLQYNKVSKCSSFQYVCQCRYAIP